MRGRLIAVAVAVTSMVAIAFLFPLAILTRDLAADRAVAAAERDASAVARLIVVIPEAGGEVTLEDLVAPESHGGRSITVIQPDGSVVGDPLVEGEDISPAIEGATFRQAISGGEAVYVPVLTAEGTYVVRAVAPSEAMTDGVMRTWAILGTLGVVLVLIAVGVADRLGRSVVRPVEELSAAASRLGEGDLDVRVEPDGPSEIEEVGRAFNRLAIQMEDLLQSEREDVADLAHRLRTPLTAARLAAEALPDDDRRSMILAQLDELHRVIDHIIDEARRSDRRATTAYANLTAVASERARFWEPLAVDERRTMSVDIPHRAVIVAIPASDLAAGIDALIGNVFSHTPIGTGFALTVLVADEAANVIVSDEGQGFPAGVDVTGRGASGGSSTGLGLDIALRLAESVGGTLTIGSSPSGGALVDLMVPRIVVG